MTIVILPIEALWRSRMQKWTGGQLNDLVTTAVTLLAMQLWRDPWRVIIVNDGLSVTYSTFHYSVDDIIDGDWRELLFFDDMTWWLMTIDLTIPMTEGQFDGMTILRSIDQCVGHLPADDQCEDQWLKTDLPSYYSKNDDSLTDPIIGRNIEWRGNGLPSSWPVFWYSKRNDVTFILQLSWPTACWLLKPEKYNVGRGCWRKLVTFGRTQWLFSIIRSRLCILKTNYGRKAYWPSYWLLTQPVTVLFNIYYADDELLNIGRMVTLFSLPVIRTDTLSREYWINIDNDVLVMRSDTMAYWLNDDNRDWP